MAAASASTSPTPVALAAEAEATAVALVEATEEEATAEATPVDSPRAVDTAVAEATVEEVWYFTLCLATFAHDVSRLRRCPKRRLPGWLPAGLQRWRLRRPAGWRRLLRSVLIPRGCHPLLTLLNSATL